ncbi:hypothetical protein FLA_0052 [Filimonas lacunae]|nr:hypothetical protein FLA_0052 [Filimonas lacunae]
MQVFKTDIYIGNNSDQPLTLGSIASSVDTQNFTNIAANGGGMGGAIEYEGTDDFNILLYFATVPTRAVANIYLTTTLIGSVPITGNVASYHIPPSVGSNAIIVRIEPI